MDGWNTSFLLGRPIFRCYVSCREGNSFRFTNNPEWFWLWDGLFCFHHFKRECFRVTLLPYTHSSTDISDYPWDQAPQKENFGQIRHGGGWWSSTLASACIATPLFSTNSVGFEPQKPRNCVMKIIVKVAGFSFLNLPSIDHSDESRVPSDSNKKRCKRDMLMDDRLNNTSEFETFSKLIPLHQDEKNIFGWIGTMVLPSP